MDRRVSERLDVLLVRPWARSAVPEGSLVEDPLGVGYLASALREAGFTVAMIDAYTFGLDDAGMVQCILQLDPRVIGVSLHSFADYRHAVAIVDGVAYARPEIYRIIGGEHATFLAEELLNEHASIDAVVRGEGELTAVELVRRVLAAERFPIVAGAHTRAANGRPVDGGARAPVSSLDDIPLPSKDLVDAAIQIGKPVAVSVLTGRGCTHKCTFCTANTYLRMATGVVWRRRSPAAVADELERLVGEYLGRPSVHPMVQFQDVIFLGTSRQARQWADDFVSELERRNVSVPFYFMARAEAILANESLLPRLVAVGLRSVEVGIESGVDRILNLYNKKNSAERNEAAIRLLQRHGVCYDASGFIMFDPHITLEELRVNAGYLDRLGHATWDRYVTKLQIFPGTVIRSELIEAGLFDPHAPLDDVYAYAYEDWRVAELARYVWMYDESVRALDTALHNARALVASKTAPTAVQRRLRRLIGIAQGVYRDFFLDLVDLAETETLAEAFEPRLRTWLARVHILHAAVLRTVEHATDLGGVVPAPPPAAQSEAPIFA